LNFLARERHWFFPAQNAARAREVPAEAPLVRQINVIDQFIRQPHRIRRTHRAQGSLSAQIIAAFAEKNRGTIYPQNTAHQEQELFQQTFRVQRMSEDDREIAHDIECLKNAGRSQAEARFLRPGDRRRSESGLTARFRSGCFWRFRLPLQQCSERACPHRLDQDMPGTMQISFFQPLKIALGNENNNRRGRTHAPNLIEQPCSLHLIGIEIEHAKVDPIRAQKRFGLCNVDPVHNLERSSAYRRRDPLRKRWVRRKDQNCFHDRFAGRDFGMPHSRSGWPWVL